MGQSLPAHEMIGNAKQQQFSVEIYCTRGELGTWTTPASEALLQHPTGKMGS
jgi:hypothetical protein